MVRPVEKSFSAQIYVFFLKQDLLAPIIYTRAAGEARAGAAGGGSSDTGSSPDVNIFNF